MGNANKTAAALVWLVLASVSAWAKPNLNALGNQCRSQRKQSACNELAKIALGDKDPSMSGCCLCHFCQGPTTSRFRVATSPFTE
jgi:hypothetical protein